MRGQVVSFVAFTAALVVVVGCGDTDAPTAPTAPSAMQRASQAGAPAVLPARFDAPAGAGSSLAPRSIDGFNAYDFHATWDGSMLNLTLVEDDMRSMREASKPHRNRRITVGACPGRAAPRAAGVRGAALERDAEARRTAGTAADPAAGVRRVDHRERGRALGRRHRRLA